jgi:hypothetical protein
MNTQTPSLEGFKIPITNFKNQLFDYKILLTGH